MLIATTGFMPSLYDNYLRKLPWLIDCRNKTCNMIRICKTYI